MLSRITSTPALVCQNKENCLHLTVLAIATAVFATARKTTTSFFCYAVVCSSLIGRIIYNSKAIQCTRRPDAESTRIETRNAGRLTRTWQSAFERFPKFDFRLETIQKHENEIAQAAKTTIPVISHLARDLFTNLFAILRTQHTFLNSLDNKKLFQRLLTCVPASFVAATDDYIPKTGGNKLIEDQVTAFNNIGTESQTPPLVIKEYLCPMERLLSALIVKRSHVRFINNCYFEDDSRYSHENGTPHAAEGFLFAIVPPRFEAPALEYQQMIIKEGDGAYHSATCFGRDGTWNQEGHYMKHFAEFYNIPYFPTFEEAKVSDDCVEIIEDGKVTGYFNIALYKKRMEVVLEPLFDFAINHHDEEGKKAYIRIPGIGLGHWSIDEEAPNKIQGPVLIQVCQAILAKYPNAADKIAHVAFTGFRGLQDEHRLDNLQGIDTSYPMDWVGKPHPEDTFLVTCYHCDGNARIGNDLYYGHHISSHATAVPLGTGAYISQDASVLEETMGINLGRKVEFTGPEQPE